MKREPGFYWIKVTDRWVIGRFKDEMWTLSGTDFVFVDGELTEIKVPRLKYPDEK